jgi:sugar phosphate isomerase/epimerase
MDLRLKGLGRSATLREAIELAGRHGFESVEPNVPEIEALSAGPLDELLGRMRELGLVFGATGPGVNFQADESIFRSQMTALPQRAAILRRAGVRRLSAFVNPMHPELSFADNWKLHQRRLRELASVLHEHGLLFGLEYLGPKTYRTAAGHLFIHTLAQTRELLASLDRPNVGFVLDSWHWFHADETVDDLLQLRGEEVVAIDLSDAPLGVPKDEMPDLVRELPFATGVIDLAGFLTAMRTIGADCPVRIEPFGSKLQGLSLDETVSLAAAAERRAFTILRSRAEN